MNLVGRNALEKMIQVYQTNPSLGDPRVVVKQLEDRSRAIDGLNAERHKFEVRSHMTKAMADSENMIDTF